MQVQIEGKGTLEFPDGTDPAVIDMVVQRDYFGRQPDTQASPSPGPTFEAPDPDEMVDMGNLGGAESGGDRFAIGRGLAAGTSGLFKQVGTALQMLGDENKDTPVARKREGYLKAAGYAPDEIAKMKPPGPALLKKVGDTTSAYWDQIADQYGPTEDIQGSIIENPGLLKSPKWWGYNVSQMLPSTVAALTAFMAGGPVAGGIVGGGLEGLSTYDTMIEQGETPENAKKAMLLMGSGSAALNAIPFASAVNKVPGLKAKVTQYLVASGLEGVTEWLEEPWEAISKGIATGRLDPEEIKRQTIEGLNVLPVAMVQGLLIPGAGAASQKSIKDQTLDTISRIQERLNKPRPGEAAATEPSATGSEPSTVLPEVPEGLKLAPGEEAEKKPVYYAEDADTLTPEQKSWRTDLERFLGDKAQKAPYVNYAERTSPPPVETPELSPPPGSSGTEQAAPAPLEWLGRVADFMTAKAGSTDPRIEQLKSMRPASMTLEQSATLLRDVSQGKEPKTAAQKRFVEFAKSIQSDLDRTEIPVSDLQEGQQFTRGGEKYKVTDVQDTGFPWEKKVTVKDGITFELQGDETIDADRGSVKDILALSPQEAFKKIARPKQEGLSLGQVKGEDLRAPERQNKPVSMNELPLGQATNEAADRTAQVKLFEADKARALKGREITPEQKAIIEQGGGIPYAYDRETNQVYFHEPSGSTLQLPADKLTAEAVRAKVEGYGKTTVIDKLTDIYKRSKLSGEGGGVGEKSISPAFYSKLQKTIDLSMPNRASGEVVRNIIKDVKADEIKWSGIDDYLAEHQGMVEKKELLDYLRANKVEVKEVVKGGVNDIAEEKAKILRDRVNADSLPRLAMNVGMSQLDAMNLPHQLVDGRVKVKDLPEKLRKAATGYLDLYNEYSIARDEAGKGTPSKFANYQLPGGENYREMLLTLPKEKAPFNKPRPEPLTALPPEYQPIHDHSRPEGTQWAMTHDSETSARPLWNRHPTPEAAQAEGLKMLNLARMETWEKEKRDYRNDTTGDYKSSHWDEPNVLAHVRMNDRVDAGGKKVLFIEEVQSDWAQTGRSKGFVSGKYTVERITGGQVVSSHDSYAEADRAAKEYHKDTGNAVRVGEPSGKAGVPDMPFSKSWPLLAMKRMIRYAAENGYDKIAWTTGAQQAARYDLSKQVDRITYTPDKETLHAYKGGDTVISERNISPDKLESYIGKEATRKLLASPLTDESRPEGGKYAPAHMIQGEDLKVGGEGMKGFYDQILPAEVNKYVKKWGARVGDVQLGEKPYFDKNLNREVRPKYAAVPGIDITPSMKSTVLYEGQELYSFPGVPSKLTKELADAYKRPPEWTESKKIIGQYTGALQEIDFKLSKLAKEINAALPKERQEAVTNYMQAGGDTALLSERARSSDLKYRKGYEDAANLTPEEKQWADSFRKRLDDVWQQAHEAGIMEDYVENYVRGEWERPEQAGKKLIAMVNSGIFRMKPREALHKVFQDYFEGEQAGFKPKNKRIGYQLVAAERSIRSAIEARKALRNMMASTEADGRPTVAVGGGGSYSPETPGAEKKAYYVKPNVKGKDVADYKFLDHPSLRKWKWVDMDSEGKPILLEGNMWIHPEAFGRINALLGKSKIKTYTVPEKVPIIGGTQPGRVALQAGAFIKGTILIGPFHQFHVGEHALFHKVNPFSVPAIDFDTRPILREGVEHGLMLYNHNAMLEFGEGLASGGLFHRIPKVGDQLKRYQEWLFQDYIPRLKAAMYEHAVTRAEKYYAKDLASGKLTRDQLLDNAAKQANAAFGEQNYRYIGRNPTLQDALRIGLLAPDFLEARLKFAGQAVRPYGKEQAMALIRGAIIMATTAQILNMLIGDDHKPRWDRPFSLIIGGREYSPRSVVADIGHLITDPRSFWYHRLNPLWGRPVVELVSGKDRFGRKVNAVDTAKDVLKSWTPIPAQGLVTKKDMGKTAVEAVINSLLQSIGVSNYPYKSNAEKLMSEMQSEKGTFTSAHPEISQAKRDIKYDIRKGKVKGNFTAIGAAAQEKGVELSQQQKMDVLKRSKLTAFQEQFKWLSAEQGGKAWDKATDKEKAQIARIFRLKIANAKTLPMEEKKKLREKIDAFEKRKP